MKKIWHIFLEAIKGAPRDYTEGSISKAVILLGIPMVMEMLMESLFAVTDIFFVGKLGPQAIATIGLTESLLTLVYTVAFGLSIGAMAMMARRVGEQDREGASNTAVQVIVLGCAVSALLAAFGVALAPQLLTLMGGSDELVLYATPYTRVMFGGNASILLLFLANAVFRGAGDGTIAMRALWIANGLNLMLAPCFVYGLLFFPELGVTGAAWATTLSRGVGALYTLSHLFRGLGRVKVERRHLTLNPDVMWKMIKLSASGTLQIFISTASWVGMVRVISTFGSEAVAGYTVGIRVMLFAIFPAFGLSNAAATMVGQSLGANKPERAEKAVWLAGFYNLAFLGVMGLLFLVFTPTIIGWFTEDAKVMNYAVSCLRTVSCGFFFYAFGMVLTQSFNGAGDTWTPTWINFLVFWVFEIPLAYVLAWRLDMGPQGAFLAVMLAFSSLAVVSAVVFRQGKWKKQKV
ncbi:MAG: putative FMN/FAD exporter YeeO [Elusimicrobia bacterium]|nr:putative FMN/FAD exporter YeeO [Elusimicrobiota bacterium]